MRRLCLVQGNDIPCGRPPPDSLSAHRPASTPPRPLLRLTAGSDVYTSSAQVPPCCAARHCRICPASPAYRLTLAPGAAHYRVHSAIIIRPSGFLPCTVHRPVTLLSVTANVRTTTIDDQTQEQADPAGAVLGEEAARGGGEGCQSAARAHQPREHLLHELDAPRRTSHPSSSLSIHPRVSHCRLRP